MDLKEICSEAQIIKPMIIQNQESIVRCPHKDSYCIHPKEWMKCDYHPLYEEYKLIQTDYRML